MGSTDIRAHVRLNTFAEWTSKAAPAAFDIPYHSHPGGTSQGAGKVFSQLFAFQRTPRPAGGTSALTSGPVSTTIMYGRLDDLRQGFPPLFDVFAAWVPLGPAFYMPRFPVCLCGRAKPLCLQNAVPSPPGVWSALVFAGQFRGFLCHTTNHQKDILFPIRRTLPAHHLFVNML